MFIYLFRIDGTNLLKIGLTDCLEKRIQGLNIFSGLPLALRPKIRGCFINAWKYNVNSDKELKKIETIIHVHFDAKRDRDNNGNESEFFEVTYDEVNSFIINTFSNILHNTFNYKEYVLSKELARKLEQQERQQIHENTCNIVKTKIMSHLNMSSSSSIMEWTVEELDAIKIKLNNIEDNSESSILDTALKTCSYQDRSGKAESKISTNEHLVLKLSRIFNGCGKFKIIKDYRIINDGKDKRVPHKMRPERAPDFNTWQKAGSPQRLEAVAALGEASWPIIVKWLKDKYDDMYPLESPITGMQFIPNTLTSST